MTTPKRWRARFSLRTLVVLVTLVCCYAACWGPTKTRGVVDVASHVNSPYMMGVMPFYSAEVISPFLVSTVELGPDPTGTYIMPRHRRYYFWFFGYVAKLPYERDVPLIFRDRPATSEDPDLSHY